MEEFMVQLARVVKMPRQMRNSVTIVAALNIYLKLPAYENH